MEKKFQGYEGNAVYLRLFLNVINLKASDKCSECT